MVILQNWRCVSCSYNPYLAPELRGLSLTGNAYGHPKFEDGKNIRTSAVVLVDGRVVQTRSGTRYLLGRVDPDYRKYLRKIRPDWNWRQPLRMEKYR